MSGSTRSRRGKAPNFIIKNVANHDDGHDDRPVTLFAQQQQQENRPFGLIWLTIKIAVMDRDHEGDDDDDDDGGRRGGEESA